MLHFQLPDSKTSANTKWDPFRSKTQISRQEPLCITNIMKYKITVYHQHYERQDHCVSLTFMENKTAVYHQCSSIRLLGSNICKCGVIHIVIGSARYLFILSLISKYRDGSGIKSASTWKYKDVWCGIYKCKDKHDFTQEFDIQKYVIFWFLNAIVFTPSNMV